MSSDKKPVGVTMIKVIASGKGVSYGWVRAYPEGKNIFSESFLTEEEAIADCVRVHGQGLMNPTRYTLYGSPETIESLKTVCAATYLTEVPPSTLHLGTIPLGGLTWHIWLLEKPDKTRHHISAPFATAEEMYRDCVDEVGLDLFNPKKITINATPGDLESLKTEYYTYHSEGVL